MDILQCILPCNISVSYTHLQPGYMAMCELGRVAFGLTWDGLNT